MDVDLLLKSFFQNSICQGDCLLRPIFNLRGRSGWTKQKYALKLFHNNGDPGYAANGRDLDRFRCESQAYEKLLDSDACTRGFIPEFHGHIDQIDPAEFHPILRDFIQDKFKPRAILLEYLPMQKR
ncbi:unnamed protein product [Penicillium salamii]|nr:unnamed protein product [Penicillium salamii]